MMRAMYSGITGLKNFQLQMDVVGNNIANVNTTGFKASRVTFETTLLQTLKAGKSPENQYGGTNPMQAGLGSKISSVDKIFSQGSFQNTGKKTDLAIQGDGFFVLSDSQGNYFSRAGNFTLDSSGYLVNPSSGLKLQGWSAKIGTNGQRYVDTNEPIGDVKIAAGLVMPAKQTSFVNLAHNLNADVGVQETTMVVKSTLGKELPIKFKFVRDMRAEYKERNVYTWESELVNTGSPAYEFAKSNYDKTLKGSVELDNAGNVVKWSTFKNGMETMGVDTDSKLSIYDVSGNLRINRSNEAVDGSSAGMEIDFSTVTY
ncbi:MAG TPA: flagellar hook-basal body complex protein, partial [Petrotogaceae bacterium]|nr:flagellar hook-basal body complex protein [Petrotogaceae bacterium]